MEEVLIKLTPRKLRKLAKNNVESARAINLQYVSDTEPGISRTMINGIFVYKFNNRRVSQKHQLDRIKKLVIPPAWQNVWICPNPDGHLQVTGTDALGRKQYKYHHLWNRLRNQTKYYQLYEFGKALPQIRARLQQDLSLPGLPLEKVLAAAVSIMQCTCIRIGSASYEKLYGSFGLTTLKDRHVTINGHEMKFSFKGKKGVYHNLTLKSKKLAKIIQQCRDIPGKELFQYYNENNERKTIDSGMINNYIKEIGGGSFTAKDFRTWAGSLQALIAFNELGPAETITENNKKIVQALDMIASHLGNTRAVCRKYYVHPSVIDHYTNKTLEKFMHQEPAQTCTDETSLSCDEEVLMKILGAETSVVV